MASGGAPPASPWPGKPTRAILAAGLGSAPERTPHEPPNQWLAKRQGLLLLLPRGRRDLCVETRRNRRVPEVQVIPAHADEASLVLLTMTSLAFDMLYAHVLLRRWHRSLASGCTGREDDTEGGEQYFSRCGMTKVSGSGNLPQPARTLNFDSLPHPTTVCEAMAEL